MYVLEFTFSGRQRGLKTAIQEQACFQSDSLTFHPRVTKSLNFRIKTNCLYIVFFFLLLLLFTILPMCVKHALKHNNSRHRSRLLLPCACRDALYLTARLLSEIPLILQSAQGHADAAGNATVCRSRSAQTIESAPRVKWTGPLVQQRISPQGAILSSNAASTNCRPVEGEGKSQAILSYTSGLFFKRMHRRLLEIKNRGA